MSAVYAPFRRDEGDAEQQDKEDLRVQEGGHRRPLQTHADSWTENAHIMTVTSWFSVKRS